MAAVERDLGNKTSAEVSTDLSRGSGVLRAIGQRNEQVLERIW